MGHLEENPLSQQIGEENLQVDNIPSKEFHNGNEEEKEGEGRGRGEVDTYLIKAEVGINDEYDEFSMSRGSIISELQSLSLTPSPFAESFEEAREREEGQRTGLGSGPNEEEEIEILVMGEDKDVDQVFQIGGMEREIEIDRTFMSFPTEILEYISTWLPLKDLLAFRATNKKIQTITYKSMRVAFKIEEIVKQIQTMGILPGIELRPVMTHSLGDSLLRFRFRGYQYYSTRRSAGILAILGWHAATGEEKALMLLSWVLNVMYPYSDIVAAPFPRLQLSPFHPPPRLNDNPNLQDGGDGRRRGMNQRWIEDETETEEQGEDETAEEEEVGEEEEIDLEAQVGQQREGGRGTAEDAAERRRRQRGEPSRTHPYYSSTPGELATKNPNFWSCLGCSKSSEPHPPTVERIPNGLIKVSFWRNTDGVAFERCLCLCRLYQQEKVEVVFKEESGEVKSVEEPSEVLGGPNAGTCDDMFTCFSFTLLWPVLIVLMIPQFLSDAIHWVEGKWRNRKRIDGAGGTGIPRGPGGVAAGGPGTEREGVGTGAGAGRLL